MVAAARQGQRPVRAAETLDQPALGIPFEGPLGQDVGASWCNVDEEVVVRLQYFVELGQSVALDLGAALLGGHELAVGDATVDGEVD